MKIRVANSSDIPRLEEIWIEIFGDSYGFLSRFFDILFPASVAFAAEESGQLIGSAYVLDICALKSGGTSLPCPYIYAVGVLPEFRGNGIGKQLILACRDYCRENYGASCIVPAGSSLFDYYHNTADYLPAFYASDFDIEAEGSVKAAITQIDAEKYGELREKLLGDKAHLAFSSAGLCFLESLCQMQDGGLYILNADDSYAIAACEIGDNGLCIKEILCTDDNTRGFAAALMWHFDCDHCSYRTPANEKHPESTRAFGMLSKQIFTGPLYFGPAFD